MQFRISSYISKRSPVHRVDARVKIALLATYSVLVFLVDTWVGMAMCAAVFATAVATSHIEPSRYLKPIVPVYVLAALTIVFNGFSLNASDAAATFHLALESSDGASLATAAASAASGAPSLQGAPAVAPGLAPASWILGLAPVPLAGSFGIVPTGVEKGLFFAVRIILLVAASLVVTYTTTSTQLMSALGSFLEPLRRLRVPVDDIATTFSLALRFIPVTAEELGRIHDAQLARGASFEDGGMWQRLRAWQTALIPLFVGLFRRADVLAIAMDARCYGTPGASRTELNRPVLSARDASLLAIGVIAAATTAVFL